MYSLKNKQTSTASTSYLGIALNAELWSVLNFHKAHGVLVWIPRTLVAHDRRSTCPALLKETGFLAG